MKLKDILDIKHRSAVQHVNPIELDDIAVYLFYFDCGNPNWIRPIWSVGSYAERWSTFIPDNYDKLPISEQLRIFDDYNKLTEGELQLLEHLVRTVVVPAINSICHDNDNNEDQIIDIRNMLSAECHNMGYRIAKTANANNDL